MCWFCRLGQAGAPVRGRLAETVYVGEREVLPAGAVVEGKIASVTPASRGRRLAAMLPVQRHSWPTGTRFVPVLTAPVEARGVAAKAVAGESGEVMARLTGALTSATAKQGDRVTAVVTRPLFRPAGQLEIPAGSRVVGEVVKARPAGYWHRNGKLHFVFRRIEAPEREARTVQGYVEGVEAGFDANLIVNSEGATQVKSPKTRFVFPALAVAVAGSSIHQDYNAQGVPDQDIVGRAESGAVGFGLIGTAVAQISRNVASGFAFAGAGYGVYTTFVGKGQEIVLGENTALVLSLKERGAAQ